MGGSAQDRAEQAERVIKAASARKSTIVTAESCTAGGLARLLADAPGASEVFHGSFVVYTKEQKTAALGVPASLIARHTAVSAEVAEAMAKGALEHSPADITIAITGVLGPEPDEDGNPVGLVYLSLARRGGSTHTDRHRFDAESKDAICDSVLEKALLLLEAGLTRR